MPNNQEKFLGIIDGIIGQTYETMVKLDFAVIWQMWSLKNSNLIGGEVNDHETCMRK